MPSESTMRHAVARRDRTFDGVFVYGVITTGVFCRPSCASRPARPDNLRFFHNSAEAQRAGLRACKRCRPQHSADHDVQRMQTLARYIEQHVGEHLTLRQLAQRAELSPSHLQRKFTAVLGVSPKAFHDALRAKQLRRELHAGSKVLDSITAAGYGSPARVYEHPARTIGMKLSAYRTGGVGEAIAYAARRTSLGLLMMAATAKGICFVQFGSSEAMLVKQLKSEFPKATITPSDLDAWIQALEAHVATCAPRPELPLDLRGTAFQLRVWKFLLGVSAGDVVSYGQLAQSIGSPKAIRAAASACAANRIAVLVPCHRVLRGDGSLGGYRWGLERKRALLDTERARRVRPI
jgi:AraC family transcriptional regulator of adaptative response/methylated-DNA-[protein]-cysteine methyltransferase